MLLTYLDKDCPIAAIHRNTEAYAQAAWGSQRRDHSFKHDQRAPLFCVCRCEQLIARKGLHHMDALAGPTAVGLTSA